MLGISGSLPLLTILGYGIRGILACLPLILLQLIVSIRSKTFGIPLAVSIVFTLPAIIIGYTWPNGVLAIIMAGNVKTMLTASGMPNVLDLIETISCNKINGKQAKIPLNIH